MTQVLFDHQKFTTQRYGGISRYFANLLAGIRRTDDVTYRLGVLHTRNHYLAREPMPLAGRVTGRLLTDPRYTYRLNEWYSAQLLARRDVSVFHPTYYNPYFLKTLRKPLVITVHDMIHERLPTYFWAQDPLTHHKRLNIERADAIIAVSNATRADLLACYPVDPAKVRVIHHGIDLDALVNSTPVAGLPADYLLYVGDRSGYKNFHLFVEAFRQLATRYPDLHVVLAGGGTPGVADREFIHRRGLAGRIRHVNATDAELTYLYQRARLFVYPSLCEGFGLPILEAFMAGCPVVLSDTACFREVAADAAAYFGPTSPDALIAVVETLLTDTQQRTALIERGTGRLRHFPLEPSIQRTLDVYKSLA